MEAPKNTNRPFKQPSYGNNQMDKSTELNSSMSITSTSPDEYERKIFNIGGSN